MWIELVCSAAAVGLTGYYLVKRISSPLSPSPDSPLDSPLKRLQLVITADAGCFSRDIAESMRARAVMVRQLPLPALGDDLVERSTTGHSGLDEQRAILTFQLSEIRSDFTQDETGQYQPLQPVSFNAPQPYSLLTLSAQCTMSFPVSRLADYLDDAAKDIDTGITAVARFESGCGYKFRLTTPRQIAN